MRIRIIKISTLITLISSVCFGQNLKCDTIKKYQNNTYILKSDLIPDSVFEMKNLISLSITGMDCDYIQLDEDGNDITECWMIKEIPPMIKKLKNLEYLQFNVNAIRTVPKEIGELNKLIVIDLSDNPSLENLDNLMVLNNLKALYLYGCNLEKLPSDLKRLESLKKLSLVGNNFDIKEQQRIIKELPNCEIIFE